MFSEPVKNDSSPSLIELLEDAISGLREGDPADEILDDLLLAKQLLTGKDTIVE